MGPMLKKSPVLEAWAHQPARCSELEELASPQNGFPGSRVWMGYPNTSGAGGSPWAIQQCDLQRETGRPLRSRPKYQLM